MRTAVVFPGQGSQAPGAGLPWLGSSAWSVVAEAEAITDHRLEPLLTDPDVDLSGTRESQLSVLLASLVAWRAVEPLLGDDVVAVAGHSLGQVTALIASGCLSLDDGVRVAHARAEACADAQAARPGGLVVLLGSSEHQAKQACAAARGRAWIANVNGAGQVVVGGHLDVLDTVAEAARDLGVRRVRRLAVDGAFHTPLMAAAGRALRPVVEDVTFRPPRWPVVTNHDAVAVTERTGWPERLVRHLVEPVRWDAVVDRLVSSGVDVVVEVGPGNTLSGLVRRIDPSMEVRSVSAPGDLPDLAVLLGVAEPVGIDDPALETAR